VGLGEVIPLLSLFHPKENTGTYYLLPMIKFGDFVLFIFGIRDPNFARRDEEI